MKPSYHLGQRKTRGAKKWRLTIYDLPLGLSGSRCGAVDSEHESEVDALYHLAGALINSLQHVASQQYDLRRAVATLISLLPRGEVDDGSQWLRDRGSTSHRIP